jgi:hypothetical protein
MLLADPSTRARVTSRASMFARKRSPSWARARGFAP